MLLVVLENTAPVFSVTAKRPLEPFLGVKYIYYKMYHFNHYKMYHFNHFKMYNSVASGWVLV